MLRRKIGDFYITELVGKGGMSQVYLAVHPRTREKRAVKVLPRTATRHAAGYARFLREIQIILSLRHPRIVRVLQSGELDDAYYYMMDFFPSGSLARYLATARPRLGESIRIILGICEAMAHAHALGIVHRDLKPANVLLGEGNEPMVSDFGVAKVIAGGMATLTRSNEVLGTLAYLAPEQRQSAKHVDQRADVFALGAIFYEMIMGYPPLGRCPWPAEILREFPPAIDALLRRSLSQNPADRPSDASILLREIPRWDQAEVWGGGTSSMEGVRSVAPIRADTQPGGEDRIAAWLEVLRQGTTRERLGVVREMTETMSSSEAKSILKIFPAECDRVRWGLIRALGGARVMAAVPLITRELENPFLKECAVEALGHIGAAEGFLPIAGFLNRNPESAVSALNPLATTGKERAIPLLSPYLAHELAVVRQAAVRALSSVPSRDSISVLAAQLVQETDEKIRQAIREAIQAVERGLIPSTVEDSIPLQRVG